MSNYESCVLYTWTEKKELKLRSAPTVTEHGMWSTVPMHGKNHLFYFRFWNYVKLHYVYNMKSH
jgi:hypothetical protein